jgi:hypothetical protein
MANLCIKGHGTIAYQTEKVNKHIMMAHLMKDILSMELRMIRMAHTALLMVKYIKGHFKMDTWKVQGDYTCLEQKDNTLESFQEI